MIVSDVGSDRRAEGAGRSPAQQLCQVFTIDARNSSPSEAIPTVTPHSLAREEPPRTWQGAVLIDDRQSGHALTNPEPLRA
jgi:hypothetical protein